MDTGWGSESIIFEQAALGVLYTALDGRILRANPYFCGVLGYSGEKLTQLYEQDITYPEDWSYYLAQVEGIKNGEIDSCTIKKRYIHKNGGRIWVNQMISMTHNDQDGGSNFVSIVSPIKSQSGNGNRKTPGEEMRTVEGTKEAGKARQIDEQNAIQRARLHEQTLLRTRELQELYELSLDLAGRLDLAPLLNTIVERASNLLDASGGFIYLFNPESNSFEVVAAKNSPVPVGTRVPRGFGMVGQVAESRTALIVDDYSGWDKRLEELKTMQIGAVVEVPMLYRGDLVGVLGVHELMDADRRFGASQAELLFLFAGHAAGAIQNTRLLEETKRQLNQLQALRNIDKAIISKRDIKSTMDVLLSHVTSNLDIDAATILKLNTDNQHFECVAGAGFHLLEPRAIHFDNRFSPAGIAATTGRTVTLSPLSSVEDRKLYSLMAAEGFDYYCASPLVTKGTVRGVVEIYHRKSIQPNEDWKKSLEAFVTQIAIAIDNIILFEDLQRSNAELAQAYNATLEGWSKALELRDFETEGHSQRVTEMTMSIAKKLGVDAVELPHIRRGALLHDIGKMGISDTILFKPGALNEYEWEIMRRHPVYAYELLSTVEFLKPALDIPYYHHERWNGGGYPCGLKGSDIPLSARIFAVADVWDALISDRPYRSAWSRQQASEYIRSEAGKHFDPQVVEAFEYYIGGSRAHLQQ